MVPYPRDTLNPPWCHLQVFPENSRSDLGKSAKPNTQQIVAKCDDSGKRWSRIYWDCWDGWALEDFSTAGLRLLSTDINLYQFANALAGISDCVLSDIINYCSEV